MGDSVSSSSVVTEMVAESSFGVKRCEGGSFILRALSVLESRRMELVPSRWKMVSRGLDFVLEGLDCSFSGRKVTLSSNFLKVALAIWSSG